MAGSREKAAAYIRKHFEPGDRVLVQIPLVAKEAVPKLTFGEIFLQLLKKDAPFFSLKLEYEGDTLVNAVLNGEKL